MSETMRLFRYGAAMNEALKDAKFTPTRTPFLEALERKAKKPSK